MGAGPIERFVVAHEPQGERLGQPVLGRPPKSCNFEDFDLHDEYVAELIPFSMNRSARCRHPSPDGPARCSRDLMGPAMGPDGTETRGSSDVD
jgi:hypothetical protein